MQALLDNSEELLQPLRKKGIKVLLDILGNHDQAGLAGLTDYGCEQFGRELAQICLDYKLDGVGFDDEYSTYGYSTTLWFAPPQRGACRPSLLRDQEGHDGALPLGDLGTPTTTSAISIRPCLR